MADRFEIVGSWLAQTRLAYHHEDVNRPSRSAVSAEDRRLGNVVGLAVALGVGRVLMISVLRGYQPMSWPQLPLFFRQDARLIFVLAWVASWPGAATGTAE